MKKEIHPDYKDVTVVCTCGAEFKLQSTRAELTVNVCSNCHPFFTGKQRFLDSAGRVDKFQKRFEGWDVKAMLEKQKKK